jgi:hypothetical protein
MRRWRALSGIGHPEVRHRDHLLEVRYLDAPGVREELATLAGLEQQCCAFVVWGVGHDGDRVVLRVTADPGNPDAVAAIAALFGAD